jgi:hypothetical protein
MVVACGLLASVVASSAYVINRKINYIDRRVLRSKNDIFRQMMAIGGSSKGLLSVRDLFAIQHNLRVFNAYIAVTDFSDSGSDTAGEICTNNGASVTRWFTILVLVEHLVSRIVKAIPRLHAARLLVLYGNQLVLVANLIDLEPPAILARMESADDKQKGRGNIEGADRCD